QVLRLLGREHAPPPRGVLALELAGRRLRRRAVGVALVGPALVGLVPLRIAVARRLFVLAVLRILPAFGLRLACVGLLLQLLRILRLLALRRVAFLGILAARFRLAVAAAAAARLLLAALRELDQLLDPLDDRLRLRLGLLQQLLDPLLVGGELLLDFLRLRAGEQ